jgi:hypothetical protein
MNAVRNYMLRCQPGVFSMPAMFMTTQPGHETIEIWQQR